MLFNFLSLVWATYSATSTWCCLGSLVVFLLHLTLKHYGRRFVSDWLIGLTLENHRTLQYTPKAYQVIPFTHSIQVIELLLGKFCCSQNEGHVNGFWLLVPICCACAHKCTGHISFYIESLFLSMKSIRH